MSPDEIAPYISGLDTRLAELERQLADPQLYSRQRECRDVSRERQKLLSLFQIHGRWTAALNELAANQAMLRDESDEELKELAAADIAELEAKIPALERELKIALLPPDPCDGKDIIVEIRPAAGGDEAGLFAGDLYHAYTKFAEAKGWKCETLEFSGNQVGGLKEVVFSLAGDAVYSLMKYEFGVHRVQRIPSTESQGRIHTSTVTVAVLPEAEEVDVRIDENDLRFDYFRSSGPGGQCVNTTDSAVRVTHIPTGISVASQQEKSQHRNKDTALRILRSRILEATRQQEAAKQAASKREQIGSGDRSERIRTYNYPQNRVTDHRFGVSVHDLPGLMEGKLEHLFEEIVAKDCELRLAALGGR